MLDQRLALSSTHRWFQVAAGALLVFPSVLLAQTSVLTWHNDAARTGQNLLETLLTPANVSAATFGKLFTLPVDGKVDGEPLYVPSLTIPNTGNSQRVVRSERAR